MTYFPHSQDEVRIIDWNKKLAPRIMLGYICNLCGKYVRVSQDEYERDAYNLPPDIKPSEMVKMSHNKQYHNA